MPVRARYRRAAFAAVVSAAAVIVPVAAFASGPGPRAAKPAHSATTLKTKPTAGAANPAAASQPSAALASSAGISQSRLDTGLADAKRAGGNTSAGIAAFAHAAGVSPATAQRIVYAVFASGGAGATDRAKVSGAGQ